MFQDIQMCKKKGKELNHSNQLLIGLFVLFVLLVVSHDYRGIMANKKQEPFTNTCVHLEVLDGAVLLIVLVFFVFCCCLVSFRLVFCMPNVFIVYGLSILDYPFRFL